jgi:hypothetical protein
MISRLIQFLKDYTKNTGDKAGDEFATSLENYVLDELLTVQVIENGMIVENIFCLTKAEQIEVFLDKVSEYIGQYSSADATAMLDDGYMRDRRHSVCMSKAEKNS